MVSQSQVRTINLNHRHINLVKKYALTACIGGKSQIHQDSDYRKSKLLPDQIIGQAGTLALHLYSFHPEQFAIDLYCKARNEIDKNPFIGDGGQDIIDIDIDIKTSLIRRNSRNQNPLTYNLAVRPNEFKNNWIYILGLIFQNNLKDEKINVMLIGWAESKMFPSETNKSGTFANTYTLLGKDLNSFPLPVTLWKNKYPNNLKEDISNNILTF